MSRLVNHHQGTAVPVCSGGPFSSCRYQTALLALPWPCSETRLTEQTLFEAELAQFHRTRKKKGSDDDWTPSSEVKRTIL